MFVVPFIKKNLLLNIYFSENSSFVFYLKLLFDGYYII